MPFFYTVIVFLHCLCTVWNALVFEILISCSLGNYTFFYANRERNGHNVQRPSVKDFLEDNDLSIMKKEQWDTNENETRIFVDIFFSRCSAFSYRLKKQNTNLKTNNNSKKKNLFLLHLLLDLTLLETSTQTCFACVQTLTSFSKSSNT